MNLINEYFKNKFVITNPNNLTKFYSTALKLSKLGIKFERYDGLYGQLLQQYVPENPMHAKNKFPNLVAQNYSHYSLIQKAKDNNWENIFIMEDDLMLHNDFHKIINNKIEVLQQNKWDISLFGHVSFKKVGTQYFSYHSDYCWKETKDLEPDIYTWFLHCYAVNHTCYDKILSHVKDNTGMIDDLFMDYIYRDPNYTCVIQNPPIAIQIPQGFTDCNGIDGNCNNWFDFQINPKFKATQQDYQ